LFILETLGNVDGDKEGENNNNRFVICDDAEVEIEKLENSCHNPELCIIFTQAKKVEKYLVIVMIEIAWFLQCWTCHTRAQISRKESKGR